MTLRSQNLNLIPILQALLHAEGVVGAAHDVHLAQPTVSGALARLREALDDPILVRVGRGMRLTPRAQQLRAQVDKICADIDLLFQPHTFDPTAAEHDFVIAAPDHLAYLLSKALIARLPYEAPGVRIRFVDVPLNLADLLHDGTVDLGVAGNFGIWPSVNISLPVPGTHRRCRRHGPPTRPPAPRHIRRSAGVPRHRLQPGNGILERRPQVRDRHPQP